MCAQDAKDRIQAKQQDKLLFVCFHVLINLAEDNSTERKMVKRELIEYLGSVLSLEARKIMPSIQCVGACCAYRSLFQP